MTTINFFSNEKLNQLVAQVKEALAKMTPEERAALDRETAIDFAYGNLTCTGRRSYITRELVERLYDERIAKDD
jgi:hypothetical protein